MKYNDGKPHIDFYDRKDEYESIAGYFSEGDYSLKDVLLNLWNNGIQTQACCKGHENNPAYISIIVNEYSYYIIQRICDNIFKLNGEFELEFISNGIEDYSTFSIYMKDENSKKVFFDFINDILKEKIDKENLIGKHYNYTIYLFSLAKSLDLCCTYQILKDEMIFSFSKKGTIYNIKPTLFNEIKELLENNQIPLGPISCTKEELEKFINKFFSNAFEEIDSHKM